MSDVRVRIDSRNLVLGAGVNGFFIRKGGLRGVLDGVDVRRPQVARNGDGNFPGKSKLAARLVPFGGWCVTDSAEAQADRSLDLTSLQSERESFRVDFELPGKTVWGMGFVSDKVSFVKTVGGIRADWDIELQFDEPVLYGATHAFGPAAEGVPFNIAHDGNEISYPVYVVEGDFPDGYTLVGPGGLRYQSTLPVTLGNPHTIDMSENYLRRDGVIVFGRTPFMDTWGVSKGESLSGMLTAPSGSGTVTTTIEDRWL